ncbi:MAG: hypothetical protein HFI33_11720 [Lachnospiraceae bacterium]|nr:hypothetical protein [Lachnospiraceae bacterium]
MHIVSSLLFGFSSSIDALLVGLSCGIRQQRFRPGQQLFISLITLAGTLLSLLLGEKISLLIPEAAAQLAGSAILIFLGLYYLWKGSLAWKETVLPISGISSCDCNVKSPPAPLLQEHALPKSDSLPKESPLSKDASTPLTCKEAALLGAALSVNNIGMGVGASITGLKLLPTCGFTLGFSLLFLYLGNRLGHTRRLNASGPLADGLSGLLLLSLGIYELFI